MFGLEITELYIYFLTFGDIFKKENNVLDEKFLDTGRWWPVYPGAIPK